jgi:hypothetical protein
MAFRRKFWPLGIAIGGGREKEKERWNVVDREKEKERWNVVDPIRSDPIGE